MDVGADIIVRGLVQGVGFRYFVARIAKELNLCGFTQNLYNGDVEVCIEGTRGAVEDLLKQIRVGPRSAHVSDVRVEWKEPQRMFKGFEIR